MPTTHIVNRECRMAILVLRAALMFHRRMRILPRSAVTIAPWASSVA